MPGFSHEECDPARAGSQPQTPRLPYLNDYEDELPPTTELKIAITRLWAELAEEQEAA